MSVLQDVSCKFVSLYDDAHFLSGDMYEILRTIQSMLSVLPSVKGFPCKPFYEFLQKFVSINWYKIEYINKADP